MTLICYLPLLSAALWEMLGTSQTGTTRNYNISVYNFEYSSLNLLIILQLLSSVMQDAERTQ